MEASGRNRTPDKLPAAEQARLFEPCDDALRRLVAWCDAKQVIGVGGFAADRAREALASTGLPITSILHPSPANPAANRGWVAAVERQLRGHGIRLPPVRGTGKPRGGDGRRA